MQANELNKIPYGDDYLQFGPLLFQWGSSVGLTTGDKTVSFHRPVTEILYVGATTLNLATYLTVPYIIRYDKLGFDFSMLDATHVRRAEAMSWLAIGRI